MSEADAFTVLDLKSAYWHIPINEDDNDKHKIAFVVPNAKYRWRVLPFGLINACRVFAFVHHVQYSCIIL